MRRTAAVAAFVVAVGCGDEMVELPRAGGPSSPTSDGDAPDGGGGDSGWGSPKSTRRDGMLRLAQLNVRRFFDTTCDSDPDGKKCSNDGFEAVLTDADFERRANQIATALATLDADVITLAEVENQACLDAINDKLGALGKRYPVAYLAETGSPGGIDVGVIARGALDFVVTHRKESDPLVEADGTKTSFTRELPEVHLTFASGAAPKEVIVFAAHFRSKSSDDPARRLAEAEKTHELMVEVGQANADTLVLLGGDLNDTPGSPPIDALEKDGALVRVAADLPKESQGTYAFNGVYQAIDHIFTTKSHASNYVAKSAKVSHDSTGGFGGSDHASIYADFTLP